MLIIKLCPSEQDDVAVVLCYTSQLLKTEVT